MKHLRDFLQDESGVAAIEYGLIAALVSIAIVSSLTVVGQNLTQVFERIASALNSA